MVDKLRAALFPSELAEELRALRTQITRLNETIESKDKVIGDLKACVVKLEDSLDDTEQCSRRANLRIQGIPDPGAGKDACAKVLDVINNAMMFQPPLSTNDIVRSHRLGRQTEPLRTWTNIDCVMHRYLHVLRVLPYIRHIPEHYNLLFDARYIGCFCCTLYPC